jgi:Listeria/Bacterioides repeat
MMRCKSLRLAAPIALAFAFLSLNSCQNPIAHATFGQVKITAASSSAKARTIYPSDIGVATYRLSGTGPASLATVSSTSGSFIVSDLAAGDWSFTVSGYDSSENLLAQGTTSVTILSGQTVTSTISLTPAATGSGSLALSLDWSSSGHTIGSVDASLTPIGGGSSTAPSFSVSGTSASCSATGLTPGSYLLVATAKNGGYAVARSLTDTVWIYNGKTTSGTLSLSSADFGPTYTLSYDVNGGSGSLPSSATAYLPGDSVTVLGNTGGLTKSGYSFSGWTTSSDGSGTVYAADSTLTVGSANVTLYAKWTVQATYTVTYNSNDSTSGTAPTDSSSYVEGATVTLATNSGSLAKDGYTFSGWNTSADGTGASYTAGSTLTMGSANLTLYAKWTVKSSYPAAGTTRTNLYNASDVLQSYTIQVSDGAGTVTTTSYDSAGTSQSVTTTIYTAAGLVSSQATTSSTSQFSLTYTYDSSNRITRSDTSSTSSGTTTKAYTLYTYSGLTTTMQTYQDSNLTYEVVYTVDEKGNVTSQVVTYYSSSYSGTTTSNSTNEYDSDGRILKITSVETPDTTMTFSYSSSSYSSSSTTKTSGSTTTTTSYTYPSSGTALFSRISSTTVPNTTTTSTSSSTVSGVTSGLTLISVRTGSYTSTSDYLYSGNLTSSVTSTVTGEASTKSTTTSTPSKSTDGTTSATTDMSSNKQTTTTYDSSNRSLTVKYYVSGSLSYWYEYIYS